jgi:DnaK suppressor protein
MTNAGILEQKQRDLLASLARMRGEARAAGESEVKDDTDAASDSEISAETLQEASLESTTLEQVEDALKRVADGTYGKCVVCGKQISAARLSAIPWTPYCLEDQEKLDQQESAAGH